MTDWPENALSKGARIGRYRIVDILGAGGFGVTYLAEDTDLHRNVAVKEYFPKQVAARGKDGSSVLPYATGGTEDYEWGLDRFKKEARLLAQIRHPNIIGVHDYIDANGTAYMIMEYQTGASLKDVLQNGPLTQSEIDDILEPLLSGLEEVHLQNILHRDIKPANIYIREDGSPVLLDFGAARQALGEHTKAFTAVFTDGFAPPEQYTSAGGQSAASDLYALGATLYHCITGKVPPPAPDRTNALVSDAKDPLIPVARAAKGRYEPGLLTAIERSLAVRESERPQSVAAFRELVHAAANGATASTTRRGQARPANGETAAERERRGPADRSGETPQAGGAKPGKRYTGYVVAAIAAVVIAVAAGTAVVLLLGDSDARIVKYVAAADEAIRAGDFENARRNIDRARELDPRDPRVGDALLRLKEARERKKREQVQALIQEADEAIRAGDFEDARQKIEEAARIMPTSRAVREARRRLVKAREAELGARFEKLFREFEAALARNDFDGAEKLLREARSLGAGNDRVAAARKRLADARRKHDAAGQREERNDAGDASLASLRRRAEAGDTGAQWELGNRFFRGRDVPRDYAEAVNWYRRSAERGYPPGQNQLGYMYDNGLGVPRSYALAARWYRRAAEQGDAQGQFNLADQYKEGHGVKRDPAAAYFWFGLAAKYGHVEAAAQMQRVAQLLSAAQRAEIDRRVERWRPKR